MKVLTTETQIVLVFESEPELVFGVTFSQQCPKMVEVTKMKIKGAALVFDRMAEFTKATRTILFIAAQTGQTEEGERIVNALDDGTVN